MKKRIISVLLATVFALSVIGCGTKDTKEQDAYRQYGITCMESGKYEDAVKAFQNALGESIGHIGEKELDICFYKAKAQALDGKTKDALATYDAIIKYNKDARAYYLRGDLYMDMGEEKKGRADFESAVQHGKKNYEIYIGIYESLSRQRKRTRDRSICLLRWRSKGINRKTNCIKEESVICSVKTKMPSVIWKKQKNISRCWHRIIWDLHMMPMGIRTRHRNVSRSI